MNSEASNESHDIRRVIQRLVRSSGAPQYVVEKDYALSYVLAGMGDVPELRNLLVFKGGTCLRKLYFPDYRFSEDLDFSFAADSSPADIIPRFLPNAIDRTRSLLEQRGPFVVEFDRTTHQVDHPTGQFEYRIRIQFPWMRKPDCSVKLEITSDETIFTPTVELPLHHSFPESLSGSLRAYSLAEVVAEKLRALLQKREQLEQRGWMSNRARDVYDLWFLCEQHDHHVDWDAVTSILPAKASTRNVAFSTSADFLDDQVIASLGHDWRSLEGLMGSVPPFDECVIALQWILRRVIPAT